MSLRKDMRSVSQLVKDVFLTVGQIEPPNPEASPGTKSAFNRMLTTVAQAAGQTLDLAVGLSTMAYLEDGNPLNLGNFVNIQDHNCQDMDVDDNEADLGTPPQIDEPDMEDIQATPDEVDEGQKDNDNEEESDSDKEEEDKEEDKDADKGKGKDQDKEKGKEKAQEENPKELLPKIQKLVDLIFAGMEDLREGLIRYDLNDLRDMIIDGGYPGKGAEYDNIKVVFDRDSVSVCSLELVTECTRKSKDIKDLLERLLECKKFALLSLKHDQVTMYMLNLVHNIDGIRAYEEWEKTKAPFRKTFICSLTHAICPREYHAIEIAEKDPKIKSKDFTKLTTPIRKKHSKMMDCQKQICFLFQTFGLIVLLEPTFLKTNSTKGWPRESTHYIKVFNTVMRRMQDYDLPAEQYYGDRKLVLGMVKVLGGETVKKYVADFLDENMYWAYLDEPESE
ncbi:hypothetical protein GYMLUDRAFT_235018 [Collybiopsis luxurians FD-317 M1]|nr:hypothetical protein GYMLUDRAFT_235018 [Collybiopsis luxurians FD-317 M1]